MVIDSYRFLDFASRQVIKAWVGREAQQRLAVDQQNDQVTDEQCQDGEERQQAGEWVND